MDFMSYKKWCDVLKSGYDVIEREREIKRKKLGKIVCKVVDVLNQWRGQILSQCIHISSHHLFHFKYLTILLVSFTSTKLEK